jgi:hypothetical protein
VKLGDKCQRILMLFGLLKKHVHLLDLVLLKSVNISGVPFNTTKPTLDGRIVGGKPTKIEHHPHQVKLLNFC